MFKTVLKSVREYKKMTLLTPLTVGIEVILEVFIPFLGDSCGKIKSN